MRLLLFFILLSAGIVALMYLIYVLLGHRLFVPMFRILKFKLDDLQRTSKKVEEIMGDDVAKKIRKKTHKKGKRRVSKTPKRASSKRKEV